MPQYLAPGVYVEEVPSAIRPIVGVGTSTAGFIGVVEYGEVRPDRESLLGRTFHENVITQKTLFDAFTLVTEDNFDAIKVAVGDDNKVQVTGPLLPVKARMVGMKLREEVTVNGGDPFPAGTVVTEDNFNAIKAAVGDDNKVQVTGPLSPMKAHLVGMTLDEPVKKELTVAKDTPVTKENADEIVVALDENQLVKVVPIAPVGEPQLVTNFGQYTRLFGGFAQDNEKQMQLTHAVYGFFNNGGSRCWVTSVEEGKGADDNAKLQDFQENVKAALDAFKPVDEIAIVAVPGSLDKEIQEATISHCENAGDRFAILDGLRLGKNASLTPAVIQGGLRNSDYAAMYYPWIDIGETNGDGKPVYFPPSGHLAGIYAGVDNLRGVHKAPANEVIRGAIDVERLVSKADQDGLNPDGINVIRKFNGNITVWGARTLGGDANTEWKYINVRRLFLFLRESIDEGTQWVVFEPNSPDLWAKITRNVTAFLTNVWRDGALFGNTAQDAFYVRCNAETNPPEVRDLGRVVTEIGVAPVKPAEFVIFRISQWAGPPGSS